METFNFPFHGNPSMSRIELKGGFRFSNEPSEPILRLFSLTFPAMVYKSLPNGDPDALGTIDANNNIMALWEFYKTHGTWKSFIYPHPVFGNVIVRFDTPFTIPQVTGNRGLVSNVEVKFREHPS